MLRGRALCAATLRGWGNRISASVSCATHVADAYVNIPEACVLCVYACVYVRACGM
jgi:hypothetical protein